MNKPLRPVSFAKPTVPAPRISAPRIPGRRDSRFWTEAENELLRRYYPDGGLDACAAHLPAHHSSKPAIYAQANKLGLRRAGKSPHESRDYGPAMDDVIRREWPLLDSKRKGVVNELADRLEVPRWWLSKRARFLKLEVIIQKKEPRWTAAEDQLMTKVPLHDPDRCAEIFREHGFSRTSTAIVVRCKRLDLSRRASRPTLSATEAAAILGVDIKTITGDILCGNLLAVKRQDKRLPQQGGSAWDIERADFRRYVVEQLGRIDFRKVDKFALVDILVSPTPAPAAVGS